MKISLILTSYKRPHLLRLGLSSILRWKTNLDLEILVLNDGLPDETEEVCKRYVQLGLPIKYIFTGQRNLGGEMKHRVAGFGLNIGVKQCTGEIIILSCAEIYHLNPAIEILYNHLKLNPNYMVIPELMYFDQKGIVTEQLNKMTEKELENPNLNLTLLTGGGYGWGHVQMPYLMAMYKNNFIQVGGYDETFTGYAAEDNDLIDRLRLKGLKHLRTGARIIHLFHSGTGDGYTHYENPAWVYNYNLYLKNKENGTIIVNRNKEWGRIDG
jgi:glycosyltransferase involved in cell wall biosynthesis